MATVFAFGDRLDATLREWHLQGTNYFNVDLEPLSSDARDRLKNGLRGTLDHLLKELKKAEEENRAMNALFDGPRKALAGKLR